MNLLFVLAIGGILVDKTANLAAVSTQLQSWLGKSQYSKQADTPPYPLNIFGGAARRSMPLARVPDNWVRRPPLSLLPTVCTTSMDFELDRGNLDRD